MVTIEQKSRDDKIDEQVRLWGGYSLFPSGGICWSCGFDLAESPKIDKEVITGCPRCHRTFVD
jgi:hypothetical protein